MTNLPIIPSELSDFGIISNTLIKKIKENPKDRISVEIGDSKQPDFKPQFKLMRWDNEVNFSVRAEEDPNAIVEIDAEKIKYITPDYEVHQYEKPTAGEDGGFEFEWFLKKKPLSNILTSTIQTKGLEFIYQGELTQGEIDIGSSRHENVVGSYAVYHATKGKLNDIAGMEYKTGKAFHLYRPKATDFNGVEIYCDLNIDEPNGLLTVTIPQKFLDNAVYPVTVDPTFGYTSIGATTNSGSGNNVQSNGVWSPATSGTATSVSLYIGNSTNDVTLGIYDSTPTNLLKDGAGGAATANDWNTRTLDTTLDVTGGTNYYLAWNHDTSANMNTKYDSGTKALKYAVSTYSAGTLAATFPSPTTVGSLNWSIYATYTASGATGSFFFMFKKYI